MADFDIAFKKVIIFEGGYIDDKDDKGGETKFGISKRSFPNIDIRELTLNNAKQIYKENYWNKIKGDLIDDQDIANNIFDCSVNCGSSTSIRLLQKVINVKIDGILGSITLGSLNKKDPVCVINMFKNERVKYYIDVCKKRKQDKKFFFGWIKRTLEV